MRPESGAPGGARPRWYVLAVLTVLVAATVLRFWHLGAWSMWVDEGMTYLRAKSGILNDQGPMYATAPLNFLVTRWIIVHEGASLFWLRFFPAFCGVAGVGAVLWSGYRLSGPVGSIAAGALVALSPWHIDWSQNARHFSAVFLFAVVAVTAFYEYWESGRLRWLVTAFVAAALGLLTHSSTVFVIAAMGVYAACLVVLPGFRPGIVTRSKVIASGVFFVALIGGYAPVAMTVSKYLGAHKTAWNPPSNVAESVIYYVGALELAMAVLIGVWALVRKRRAGLVLLCWLIVPIACVVLAAFKTISSGAYALPSLAAAALLLGTLAEETWAQGAGARTMAALVAAGIAAQLLLRTGLYLTAEQGNRPPWDEAVRWVAATAKPGEPIYASEGVVLGYYLGDDARGLWLDHWHPPAPGGTQWLLVLAGDGTIDTPPLAAFVHESCRVVDVLPRNTGPKRRDITIYECLGK
ncbi:MAG TPA: glycosyltransferase family 39 protein [Gemmatimonadales bacterium]|nr:glycosyltransferase family 39 protein [Gemmatimonadales bacterium]